MGRLVLICLLLSAVASANELDLFVEQKLPSWVAHYRWLHANPELSLEEKVTSAYLATELSKLGLEPVTGIGGTGVVAVVSGSGPGPTVLYRVDMDALPVQEATGLVYASQNPGVMHACGHDLHMAIGLGVVETLVARRSHWSGQVLFVAQPAEEMGLGAAAMLADPTMKEVVRQLGRPQLALALHDLPSLPAGSLELTPGFTYANVDSVDITVFGQGTHGARPHLGIDPIVIGAELVSALQTIVSRRLPPGTRAVVTVGRFQAGTTHNVIPDSALLQLTVRSYGEDSRQRLLDEIGRTSRHVALAHGASKEPKIVEDEYTPALYNDPDWVERLNQILSDWPIEQGQPMLIGEDFSQYGRHFGCPAVMVGLGAVDPETFQPGEGPGLHSPRWAPAAEPAIRTGVQVMVRSILAGLE